MLPLWLVVQDSNQLKEKYWFETPMRFTGHGTLLNTFIAKATLQMLNYCILCVKTQYYANTWPTLTALILIVIIKNELNVSKCCFLFLSRKICDCLKICGQNF